MIWIGVCVGMLFTSFYGALAPVVTYFFGFMVGYVVFK